MEVGGWAWSVTYSTVNKDSFSLGRLWFSKWTLHLQLSLFFSDGLGGIGMGLGPGGQPIDANHLNKGIGMGNIGPAGENYSVL